MKLELYFEVNAELEVEGLDADRPDHDAIADAFRAKFGDSLKALGITLNSDKIEFVPAGDDDWEFEAVAIDGL